jgi:hypothetical protein
VSFPLIDTGERANRTAFDKKQGGPLPRFRSYRVGLFDLPKDGIHQLSIGPTGDAGNAVRIASLVLTPAR